VVITDEKQLAGVIDHTLLDAAATKERIEQLCEEAKSYGFHTVCVNPRWLALAAERLHNTKVKVGGVVSLPLGGDTTKIKVAQAKEAIFAGLPKADHEPVAFAPLLNNCSAGQPSSFCLQYLQANEPLKNAFPPIESMTNTTIKTSISQVKSLIKIMIPPIRGKIMTRKSGIKSFHAISFSIKLSGFPFLKSIAHNLPLPSPQVLP
jgi:hypothetical protein